MTKPTSVTLTVTLCNTMTAALTEAKAEVFKLWGTAESFKNYILSDSHVSKTDKGVLFS